MGSSEQDSYQVLLSEVMSGENGAFRFRLMPTLNHMAAVKIASHLWTTKDLRDETSALFKSAQSKAVSLPSFMSLSSTIEEEVARLPLPSKLSSHVKFVASRLAIEIFKWIHCQSKLDSSFKPWEHLGCIQWTSRGRINGGMTAQLIMSKDCTSEKYKSKASSYYCFNLYGEALLKQIIENRNDNHFYERSHNIIDLETTPDAIFDFPILPEKETYIIETSDERARKVINGPNFYVLSLRCDERAMRQLWTSLAEETKVNILSKFLWCNGADLLCFFISQMDKEMQMTYLKDALGSSTVLVTLFSDWLWQDHFISTFSSIYLGILNHEKTLYLFYKLCEFINGVYANFKCIELYIRMLQITIPDYIFPTKQREVSMFNRALVLLSNDRTLGLSKLMYSLVPSTQKKEHLDSLIDLFTRFYSSDNEFLILKFIANQVFETSEEIEDYFLTIVSNLDLINKGTIKIIRIFTSMFILNEPKIDGLKRKILQNFSAIDINTPLRYSRYEDLNLTLSFCFSGDNKAILEYKKSHIFPSVRPTILSHFIVKKRSIKGLEEFFCFCFGQEEGISIGRNILLREGQMLIRIAKELFLRTRKQKLTYELLDWCFTSDLVGKESLKKEITSES